jgi:hypothetical protein
MGVIIFISIYFGLLICVTGYFILHILNKINNNLEEIKKINTKIKYGLY